MKSLFGYGKTTKALAKSGGWNIYDDKFKIACKDEIGNFLLPISEFDANKSELEIPSPGFPKNHILVKQAKNLISEYDYFFSFSPSVWISGTNGKTTTTEMIGYLIEKAEVGGNIGNPLANLNKSAPLWVLETSSFTLHYTKKAFPNVYVLLPIKEDHLSWHGSFEEYERVKLKPLSMMKKGSVVILPKKFENIQTKAFKIYYENEYDLAKNLNIEISKIKHKAPFLLDAILALSVEKILFDSISIDKINTYKIPSHKLQEFFDNKNRLWINDTKATNIDACIEAIKRYKDKKIHLILGGDDKGVNMSPLFDFMKNYNIEIYAIGSNSQKLMDLAKKYKIKANLCEILENAVTFINKSLDTSSVALLSPAAASLDQFESYAQRGEIFIKSVNDL